MKTLLLPKPMLAPNGDPDLKTLRYPIFASHKLDGVRFLIFDGKMYSRNMEPLHPAVTKHFQPVIHHAEKTGVCLDGEIWRPDTPFNQIVSRMSKPDMCPTLGLYAFDLLSVKEWHAPKAWTPFSERVCHYNVWCQSFDPDKQFIRPVEQYECEDADEILALQHEAKMNGLEGLMLKCPTSVYAHSRTTAKQNVFWKFKFWDTINGRIVDFKQKQQLTDEAKATNTERSALGRTKRGHRQDDRESVDAIGSVEIEVTDGQVFKKGTRFFACWSTNASDVRSAMTWDNREQFLGRNVEVEYQGHGSKDKPRLPRITRMRPDLD
jgi:DNA ligase-1